MPSNRYFLAVCALLFSKGIAYIGRLISLPLALYYCGVEEFALFSFVVALSAIPGMVLVRLGPRFIGYIAHCNSNNNYSGIAWLVRQGCLLSIYGACIFAIIAVIFLAISEQFGFASVFAKSKEVKFSLFLLMFINFVQTFLLVFENLQVGMNETHLAAGRNSLASVISCCGTLLLIPIFPTCLALVGVLHGIPLIARVLFAIYLWRRYSFVFSTKPVKPSFVESLSLDAAKNTLMSGLVAFLLVQSPLLIVMGIGESTPDVHITVIALQFTLQFFGLMSILVVPAIPALTSRLKSDKGAASWSFSCVKLQRLATLVASCILVAFAGCYLCWYAWNENCEVSFLVAVAAVSLLFALTLDHLVVTIGLAFGTKELASTSYFLAIVKGVVVTSLTWMWVFNDGSCWVVPFLAAGSILTISTIPVLRFASTKASLQKKSNHE